MFSLNIEGKIHEFPDPIVMGIINITPDSFYSTSRVSSDNIIATIEDMIAQGADIIDIGACSTRPNATVCTEEEELRRINDTLGSVRRFKGEVLFSIDTFRSSVARTAVEKYGIEIINDISGGEGDKEMFATVASLKTPYILCSPGNVVFKRDRVNSVVENNQSSENAVTSVCNYLAAKKTELYQSGVADVIVDPGIGFGKSLKDNYAILRNLDVIRDILAAPLLVGLSRKSLITAPLGIKADEALNATTSLNTFALMKGAEILRVHDVKNAKEVCRLFTLLK